MSTGRAVSNPERWCFGSAASIMPTNLENSAVATDWKRSVFIPIPKKGNTKECSNYRTIVLISHASKLMLKILQARLQQYMNWEISKCSISIGSWKKHEFQKIIYFCFVDYAKAFDCVDHNKPWKILQVMEISITWPASWEICVQFRKRQLELDVEKQTGSK